MNETYIKNVVEAALLAAGRPLQLPELAQLFDASVMPEPAMLRAALDSLEADYSGRGIEVKETATGFRIQIRRELANEVSRLWPERPPRYSRALLETLALIAYRQPITRGEIEAVRGVAVNPNIIKTILERNWVRVVGTRDVPGRPELLGTTKEFLDYFGLRSLEDLPPLAELKAMGEINLQLDLAKPNEVLAAAGLGDAAEFASLEAGAAVGDADAPAANDQESSDSDAVASNDGTGAADGETATPDGETATPDSDNATATADSDEGVTEHVELSAASLAVSHAEVESDAGDVTVEVETLRLVEASIEASIESDADEPAAPGSVVEPVADASIETGEFEMAEVVMDAPAPPASVIEAEFEAEDFSSRQRDSSEGDTSSLDDDTADDDEEDSADSKPSTELVAASRDRDD